MPDQLTELTANIVAAYVESNKVAPSEITGIIQLVHRALSGTDAPPEIEQSEVRKPTPAQIRKSITPDALISFEDGKPYKMLKRRLATLGLTPDQYRAKWGLPRDYPMTAAAYSEMRSAFAKSIGLGAGKAGRPKKTAGPGASVPLAKRGAGKAAKLSG
jgi:predicted transcriptional regulator